MRAVAASLAVAAAIVASACGSSSSGTAAAPPAQPAPEPGGATSTAGPSPTPQPPPTQPSPSPAPAPSPEPGGAPTTAPASSPGPAIRWAVSTPGVFWVGMDDSGARWSAAKVAQGSSGGVLRLERRDRGGALRWSHAWTYAGDYAFTVAVTPGGEPLVAARAPCQPAPATCDPALEVSGVARGTFVMKVAPDGSPRWVRALSGQLVGADADGGAALGWAEVGGATPAVVKLDAGGGTVWSRPITSLAQLRLDRSGDVLVVGCYQDDRELVPGIPCQGLTAARLGPDGAPLWTASQLGGYWPVIDTTADGTGYAAARQFTLVALSPEGAVRWTRSLGDAPKLANQRGEPLTIAAAANGPVAVAGYALAPGSPLSTPAVILGFDAAGRASFADELPFWQPAAMVYGADGALLVAVGGGAVDAPGGHVDGPMVVELTP